MKADFGTPFIVCTVVCLYEYPVYLIAQNRAHLNTSKFFVKKHPSPVSVIFFVLLIRIKVSPCPSSRDIGVPYPYW